MKEVSLSLHEVLHRDLLDGLGRLYYMVCSGLWGQIGLRMFAALGIGEMDAVENRTRVQLGVANFVWTVDVRMH